MLAHIAGDRATRRRSRSAIGVQALDKRGFGQQLTAGRPFRGTNDLQQEAVDRASIWAASVGPGSDEMLFLGPYPAAVEGTRQVASPKRGGFGPIKLGFSTGLRKCVMIWTASPKTLVKRVASGRAPFTVQEAPVHLKFADCLVVRCEMSAAFVGQKHVHGATIPESSDKKSPCAHRKSEYFLRHRVLLKRFLANARGFNKLCGSDEVNRNTYRSSTISGSCKGEMSRSERASTLHYWPGPKLC